MLGLRRTTEAQARWKKGQPHQRTTGVVRTSCSQLRAVMYGCNGLPGSISVMAIRNAGRLSARPARKRRLMSANSGVSASPAVTERGSSAMPQMGQLPGRSRTTWGCMGQVYSTFVAGAAGVSGSRAMPHLGQLPGRS
jgi:hypothetical protein